MEDPPLPDVLSFSPWEMTPEELDAEIESQYAELKALHSNERDYKLSVAMALRNAVNQRKMHNWSLQYLPNFPNK